MITFTRHTAPDGTVSHTVDTFDKDAAFHLASLDGRIPGVTLEGGITIEAANGKARYEIVGVDPTYGTILAKLVKGSLHDEPVVETHEPVSYAPEAAPLVASDLDTAPIV